jgi:hypothetical protein
MKKFGSKSLLLAFCFLGIVGSSAHAGFIDFDNVSAPVYFADTTALRELYASQGVHFGVPATLDGGAIINKGGNFGVNPLSGDNFLAFSRSTTAILADGGRPIDPLIITFDFPLAEVSIWASGGTTKDTFTMSAYNNSGDQIALTTLETQDWGELKIFSAVAAGNFVKVVLTQTQSAEENLGPYFVYDNLSFNFAPVPIPSTILLLGSGLLGLAGWRKLKKG